MAYRRNDGNSGSIALWRRPQRKPWREACVATVALRNVSKVFGDGTVAVDSVNLDVNDGEFMVLLGPEPTV